MQATILPKRPRRSMSEMFPMIEQYLASDLGRAAFCAQAGLSLPVFGYWYSKYQKAHLSSSGGFVPLEIQGGRNAVLELNLPGGILLRFMSYPDARYLRALLSAD